MSSQAKTNERHSLNGVLSENERKRRVNVSEPEVIHKDYEFELRTILSVRVHKQVIFTFVIRLPG